jgi:hypothetical protein
MLRSFLLAGIVAFAVSLTSAQAQYGYGGYDAPYYGGYGGGTVEGSVAHGYADLVRSAGAFNLMTSKAFENYEEARKKNIQNRLLWTQTYFEMRRINDEYRRAQYERDRRTQEDFIRYAQAAAPKRLASSQLDPITGYLAWPRLLLTPEFTELRRDVDQLFAERANAKGAIGNETYFKILDRVDQMQEKLRKLIKVVPTNDYIEAKKFLDSLAYEARFAAS